MTIVKTLETLKEWVDENLCEGFEFKVPSKKDGADYEYKTIKPETFILYIPAREKTAPETDEPVKVPSVCIQVTEGSDTPQKGVRELGIRLSLATWNPGLHKGGRNFERNSEGWRDVWNFADKCLGVIEGAEYLNGLRVKLEDGIKYGPIDEQDSAVSLYPYWFTYIAFNIEYGNKPRKSYINLL